MGKTKAKNDAFWQMGTLPFVMLWAGSYAAAWWMLIGVLDQITSLPFVTSSLVNFIAIALITMVPAFIQVQLVERLLKHHMRRWMLYTLAGTLLTFITFTDSSASQTRFVLTLMSLFLPVALLQAVWLWRRVQAAWLWPLATIAAGLVFSMPMRGVEGGPTTLLVIAGLLYGLVQGGIMRYLWLQPKDTEKAKVDAAQLEQLAEDRSLRLQEAANVITPRIHSNDESTQHRMQSDS